MLHLKKGNVAFWRYVGAFPYFLYGTIEEVKEPCGKKNGAVILKVLTKEYGPGHYFKPEFALPPEEAKPLIENLQRLEKELNITLKVMGNAFDFSAQNLLPEGIKLKE